MKTKLLAFGMVLVASAWPIQRLSAQSVYTPYAFTTLAGSAGYGSADGTGNAAQFRGPSSVAVDSAGNVYVADSVNGTIRKITPVGVVTTLAGRSGSYGHADGSNSDARFQNPNGVAVDSAGNVYVADSWNNTIRKVTPAGAVTTLAGNALNTDTSGYPLGGYADGTGSAALFNHPKGVAVDSVGNIYVADTSNNSIRKVTPAGAVTTLVGSAAGLFSPTGVAVDKIGNIYVADPLNNRIRKVTPEGVVTTLAGTGFGSADGTGNVAQFRGPSGVAVDSAGNVYVADSVNGTIRKITPAGVVTTLAGRSGSYGYADGSNSDARFQNPNGVAVDSAGNVYVADSWNNTIRKVTPAGAVTTMAGEGGGSVDAMGSAARFYDPAGLAVDPIGNLYVADGGNNTIRKVTPEGAVTTLAGLAGSFGDADGTNSQARFYYPSAVAVDTMGCLYVADGGNNTIRKVTPEGAVTTLAGLAGSFGDADGTNSQARFYHPNAVAVDTMGNVYVADSGNDAIRKVTPAGAVTTLVGSAAGLYYPTGVAVDKAGNIYVANSGSRAIEKVTPTGTMTRLAGGYHGTADGTGGAAQFGGYYSGGPGELAVDAGGNVYVTDVFNHTIRRVTAEGVVTTLAGNASIRNLFGDPLAGFSDGTGSKARFYRPFGVAVDGAGNLYVADTGNNTIRKGYPAPMIPNSGPDFGFDGGQFGFRLTGPSGQLVVVESSTDLLNWLPLRTNTYEINLRFSDPQSGVYSNRFYRTVSHETSR